MQRIVQQFASFQLESGTIEGAPMVERRLSDLRGIYADRRGADRLIAEGDPLVYTVASVEPADGAGQLHLGLGTIMPGRVGFEYFMTKGHLHRWRQAAEFYIGLRGEGMLLLEEEGTGESRLVPLLPNSSVYVPGYTAHRTVNTGDTPLVYLGVYPAEAGHDYAAIAARNFAHVVIDVDGTPKAVERAVYLDCLGRER